MTLKFSHCYLLICVVLLASSCSQDPAIFSEHNTVYKIGDHREWANKEFNDQDWHVRLKLVPDGQVFWSRTKIDILEESEVLHPYGLWLEAYGEYEVFWDGVLIGKNGNPGQEADLPPEGELWVTFNIPPHLANVGEHVIALRLSNYYYPDHVGDYWIKVDNYKDLVTDRLIQNAYMHVFAGAFLIASIYCLFLFLGNKKEHLTLILSISCFLFFCLTMTHFVRNTLPIHYSLHVIRLEVTTSLMFGISFLIPLFFSLQFPFPKRKLILGIYTLILLSMFLVDHHTFDFSIVKMIITLLIFSFAIAVFGIYKKAKGAVLVMLTLLFCIFLRYAASFNVSLFTGFSLILLNMLYLLSLRIKEQRLAYENSLVQSTRLKLELIKKNIQPHFLMNTLTSLIDWIEEAPKVGVQFIEALAKEFNLVNQMEDQTLIPIDQEIELCRTHLEVMRYRKEIDYIWEEEGIDSDEMVPPAILHTLLENGITHSLPQNGNNIRFKLIFNSNKEFRSYTFLTYAKVANHTTSKEDGTGLKYIKARLTESYQAKWDIISEPTDHGWKNVIKIYG